MKQLQADKLLKIWIAWLKDHAAPFFATLLTGCAAHGFALSNKLVNHDEVAALFFKGATVDSGRWGLELMPLIFPDYSMPWIYGIISILMIAIAVCLMVDLFRIRSKALQILLGGLIVTYPTVTGTLSYMFTATSYMFAFLLAVLGPYLLCRKQDWGSRILAVVCITLAVGIYQAYVAVAATLFVLYLIRLLLDGHLATKKILLQGVGYVAVLGICLGLYWIINRLAMLLTGMEAGVYATGAESSHGLLWRIVQAYGAFALSFVTGMNGLIPTAASRILHIVCMLIVALWLILRLRRQGDVWQTLLLIGLVCLLPLSMNCMYLIAGSGAIHTLVLYSNACVYLLAAMVLEERIEGMQMRSVLSSAAALCMALVIAGNIYTANRAYLGLHLRYENNYATCTNLVTQMQMTPGYTRKTPVLLAGTMQEPVFYDHFLDLSQLAGARGVSINDWSNRIFFSYYCGVQLPEPDQSQTDRVYASAEFAAMPTYPANGSVAMIEDVLVVKFSEE